MSRSRRLLWLLILLAPQLLQATVQVQYYRMTKPAPPDSCSDALANLPPPYSTFADTEKEAYLWFYAEGARAGDVFSTAYYTPTGQFYPNISGAFDPLPSDGNYCFTDLAFEIAGHQPATQPGLWTATVTYNGAPLFTLTFTVTSTAVSGLRLNINQVIQTSCPKNKVIVSVTDSQGNAITGLTAANFGLKEGGQSRNITVTTSGGSAGGALSLAILIDVSGSLSSTDLANEKAAAKQLIAQLGVSDAVAIYSFTDNVTLLQDFTTDKAKLNTAVDSAYGNGNTALYQAIQTASQALAARSGRKSIVLMTDGEDTVGGVTIDQAIAAARQGGVPVFPVGFGSVDQAILTRIANETGGFFSSGSTSADLQRILQSLGQVISSQYEISYTSGTPSTANTIEITVSNSGQTATAARSVDQCSGSAITNLRLNINQVIETNCPNNKLIVSVTDSQGTAITGLTAANFTLTEGGQTRTITVTSAGGGSAGGALSIAILIDVSGSLTSTDLANEKAAAKQLVAQLGTSDAVAIYSFTDGVNLLRDFTTDKTALNTAIDSASGNGNTALYRAIQTASQALAARGGRKSIVLMTDGEDTVGGVTIDQAIDAAKQAGVPVFPVGFGSVDQAILTRIANETGGFFSSGSTSADLQRILQSLGQVMSSQYEISYTSGNPASDNTVVVTATYAGQTATATRSVSKCSGGSTGCNYFVQPLTQNIVGGGATGFVNIIAATGCTWTAVSNVSWITVLAGASGNGQGAVSYRVDPNPTSSTRTGTVTIAGQTHTVTQAGGGGCSYSLMPSSNNMLAIGGSSSTRLTTGAGCSWTASSGASWITLTSPSSGTGSAAINYSVSPNTSTSSRTGTITVSGQTFTVTQAGGASATGPNIAPGGVVNAASNRGGGIARGSFFTIYGTNLGPSSQQQATTYPIPDSLAGVTVTLTQGSITRHAYLHFVSATQINGILPSDTPLGTVQLTVGYLGAASLSEPITVVDTAFGIFSASGGSGPGIMQNYNADNDQPLNMASIPAKPGQIVILWGTGLGPISTADNQPPPGGNLPTPVEVWAGGKLAKLLYSGRAPSFAAVDNVYFEVPADIPLGCSVPVQVKAGSSWSNTVRMALSTNGAACQDAANPFSHVTSAGGKTGTVALLRVNLTGALESGQPPMQATLDLGLGIFSQTKAGGDFAFSAIMNLPPPGTCVSTNRQFDLGSALGSGGGALDPTTASSLDAGAALTVTDSHGTAKQLPHSDASAGSGPYLALLGGDLPIPGATQSALFLNPGTFTIAGPGGADVGPFSVNVTVPQPLTWTNESQVSMVTRSNGLTFNWSGGDPASTILIAGASTDQKTKGSGGFFCLVPQSAGTFTVPASTLADLPPTGATTGLSDSIAMLAITELPLSNPPHFTATGLDSGFAFHAAVIAKTVQVQ
ncbi:MAG TPA: VWA domain-containing protein [Bryobacteraceae bacterium]|nr:VWA domain-containing protein [Bryobacteraceae bacterium]